MNTFLHTLVGLSLSLFIVAGAQASPSLSTQRRDFERAEDALGRGKISEYRTLKAGLAGYPLVTYLDYREFERRLVNATKPEVQRFLHDFADTPYAGHIREAWLDQLAKRQDWRGYLDFHLASDSITEQCRYYQALIATGREAEVFPHLKAIWLHPRSRPADCDLPLDAWRGAGYLTVELIWDRFELAMGAGETRLAGILRNYLPAREQEWADRWLRIKERPELILDPAQLAGDHPRWNAILRTGIEGLAGTNPDQALIAWDAIRQRHRFDPEQTRLARQAIAWGFLRREDPRLLPRVDELTPPNADADLHEARTQAALRYHRWELLERWAAQMPPDADDQDKWRYWRARALEELGRGAEARPVYHSVAHERSFYGFLAADKIGAPYRMNDLPMGEDRALVPKALALPGLKRAREFLALGRQPDARREWGYLMETLDIHMLKAAMRVVHEWGWHDRNIVTLAKLKIWDTLELRFPTKHRERVADNAGLQRVDPAWVFAVMRQESAFIEDARSSAGALGLMQLMPATAEEIARKRGMKPFSPSMLLRPEVNIELGTAYLKRVLDRWDDNLVLATASYNAGPGRVRSWLPEGSTPADLWVEEIPFAETRKYVQNVLTYTKIYEKLLGLKPRRLSEEMTPLGSGSLLQQVEAPAQGARRSSL